KHQVAVANSFRYPKARRTGGSWRRRLSERAVCRARRPLRDAGRLGLGAACLGACKELLEMSTRFAKERKQFGEPIANFQAVQFMLAEMAALIYEVESIVYRTAWLYDRGECTPRHSAIVKLVSSNALDTCVDHAMQIHGGMGYSRELPIERFYRDSRINRIFEGTSEIQKLVIARDVIKHNGIV
ncbi:MAG: acyl-CoA dehydrogenase family protein, partial [Candidatus Kapaibacteriota bacterium]